MINFDNNKVPNIIVVGDLMIDQYLWGPCDRISPEAPVQVIDINSSSTVLGGAGNVANNLSKLGARVDLISVIGNCDISIELKNLIASIGIDTKYLFNQNNRIGSKKTRIIASQQQVVRYDHESSDDITIESQNSITDAFREIVKDYEVILLSDYGKGVLTFQLTQSLIEIANKNRKKVLISVLPPVTITVILDLLSRVSNSCLRFCE